MPGYLCTTTGSTSFWLLLATVVSDPDRSWWKRHTSIHAYINIYIYCLSPWTVAVRQTTEDLGTAPGYTSWLFSTDRYDCRDTRGNWSLTRNPDRTPPCIKRFCHNPRFHGHQPKGKCQKTWLQFPVKPHYHFSHSTDANDVLENG